MLPRCTEYLLLGSLWMWSVSRSVTVSVFRDGTVIGNAYFQLLFKAENNPLMLLAADITIDSSS